ncbi:Serine/threonine protein [Sphaerulina musiva]
MFQETPYGRIFQSYSDFGPLKSYVSVPMITDFDQADDGDFGAYPIQPDVYRAPEVLLGWGWSHSADIWNFGNLIWRLASGADLFQPSHPTTPSMYDPVIHLAQMCSVLGFPSPALLKQRAQSGAWKWTPALENSKGELCTDACSFYGGPHFDPSTGEFLHPDAVPSPQSLHDRATFVGEEERASFVDFMSKMLTWDPAARLGADDLSHHPWLVLGGRIK